MLLLPLKASRFPPSKALRKIPLCPLKLMKRLLNRLISLFPLIETTQLKVFPLPRMVRSRQITLLKIKLSLNHPRISLLLLRLPRIKANLFLLSNKMEQINPSSKFLPRGIKKGQRLPRMIQSPLLPNRSPSLLQLRNRPSQFQPRMRLSPLLLRNRRSPPLPKMINCLSLPKIDQSQRLLKIVVLLSNPNLTLKLLPQNKKASQSLPRMFPSKLQLSKITRLPIQLTPQLIELLSKR
jgi:hypothetical protein